MAPKLMLDIIVTVERESIRNKVLDYNKWILTIRTLGSRAP